MHLGPKINKSIGLASMRPTGPVLQTCSVSSETEMSLRRADAASGLFLQLSGAKRNAVPE